MVDDHGSSHRRRRRGTRHKHRKNTVRRNKKHQKRESNHKPQCSPEPAAQTCAGQCATVPNTCGQVVDCGPCACTPPCPLCQTCDASTGQCANLTDGTACGTGLECIGGACQCTTTSCASGCCQGNVCRIDEDGACGINGGACHDCTTCSSSDLCPSGQCCTAGQCVVNCPACQTCVGGVCVPDSASTDCCGTGLRCQNGSCGAVYATIPDCGDRCDCGVEVGCGGDHPAIDICGASAVACPSCGHCDELGCEGAVFLSAGSGDGWYCVRFTGLDCSLRACPSGQMCYFDDCVVICP